MLKQETINLINQSNGRIREELFNGYHVVDLDELAIALNTAAITRLETGDVIILTGPTFRTWDKDVQEFTLYHEIGHSECGHLVGEGLINDNSKEIEADLYAVKHIGKDIAHKAMTVLSTVLDPYKKMVDEDTPDYVLEQIEAFDESMQERLEAILAHGTKFKKKNNFIKSLMNKFLFR